MLSLGVLVAVLLSAESLAETAYFLFLNPFSCRWAWTMPCGPRWSRSTRATLVLGGALLLFSGLRQMAQRERLLS